MSGLMNRCPERRCDGSGWVGRPGRRSLCPSCTSQFAGDLHIQRNPLEVFNETLDRLTPEYIEQVVKEMEEERRG
jgi:hypothetical protein